MATLTQLAPPPAYAGAEDPNPAPGMPAPDADSDGARARFSEKVRFFLMMVSIYGMLMLVMIPCWNCLVLLGSWVYSQLLGAQAPLTFLIINLGLVALFVFILTLFFHSTKVEMQTFQTIVMMGSAILTLLGVIFMLFGHEVAELARTAQKDVEHNCPFSQATESLYIESKVLYALRFHDECAQKVSVEECRGFRNSHAAQVLKALEIGLKCSTFCDEVQPPRDDYPITLFSRANYQPSCQMTLVRNLKYYVEDMGVQAYSQGCMLVFVSAIIGLLKLVGFCVPQRHIFGKAGRNQGSDAEDYGSLR